MIRVGLRYVLVTVGIIVLTSVTIDATDALRGSNSALSILATKVTEPGCSADMVRVEGAAGVFCIDTYEVGVGETCPVANPLTVTQTAQNLAVGACVPVSKPDILPWTAVAKHQAEALCARAGKRLPSAPEWYAASLGTPDSATSCVIEKAKQVTGSHPACVAGSGAFDMIGNVWELVAELTTDGGEWSGETLPNEGYVAAIDSAGIAIQTTSTPQALFNDDYFWSSQAGVRAMMRGGFYGSDTDAGVYATHAAIDPTFASAAIGFRCVSDL